MSNSADLGRVLLLLTLLWAEVIGAQGDPQLVGTWTTKSRKVLTGPGFYDPVNEKFFEPDLTGISYSFTADGFYEEAYYRAIANPTTPSCPQGIIQWQHGTYTKNNNGSLTLFPIKVDGRQLRSDPCTFKSSLYTRYSQFELMKSYQVLTDPYNKAQRLNLFRFDGSPMNPMYLAYKPPQMLPTQTLNPTSNAPSATAQPARRIKRDMHHLQKRRKRTTQTGAEQLWWLGLTMTGIGGILYYCS